MNFNVEELSRIVKELASGTVQGAPTLRHMNQLLLAAVAKNEQKSHNIGWKAFYSRTMSRRGSPSEVASDPSMTTTAGLVVSDATGGGEFQSIVEDLEERGQTPDAFTYNVRLRYEAVTGGDMAAAQRVLAEMINQGIRPNVHHWLDLMRGCIRIGEMPSAERIISAMRYMKFEVDVRTYTLLLHGYGGMRQPQQARRVFQSMMDEGIRPDWGAIDALAGAYYGAKNLDEARAILLEYWTYVAPFPPRLLHAPLSVLIANFRATQLQAVGENIFSWDGGPVTEGQRRSQSRHSQAQDIGEALIKTWNTVFTDNDNRSLVRYSKENPLGAVPPGIFFVSRYRKTTLRRLGQRIWLARQGALQAWEKETGRKWKDVKPNERERLNLKATFTVQNAEMSVFNSWEFVIRRLFEFDRVGPFQHSLAEPQPAVHQDASDNVSVAPARRRAVD